MLKAVNYLRNSDITALSTLTRSGDELQCSTERVVILGNIDVQSNRIRKSELTRDWSMEILSCLNLTHHTVISFVSTA